ncbi:cation transporter [Ancylobacter amanitiformis]|uniref:Divalent metal cation (Fe/Co/Zn/Cd) transporter n=1 Tax=Ancylobacter amanitiformis TaxID=217069 RepID=A0ABU0LLI3_9HYPH|nr:cation transporter [Ancylobacter amanitiformis]MDQ0509520.1 divalent metal cation (Fe/Co/Zn/Cd) transporter [Ancylobacter amanitiformis]
MLDPASKARERSMLLGAISDFALGLLFLAAALWANSLMMMAEVIRGYILLALELVLLVLLRRIQRGAFHDFDYGAGKLEQFANAGLGTAMGLAGASVAVAASYRWWHPPEQVELGLIAAVVLSLVNLAQNGLVLRALWRAGSDGSSVIITGQVRTRLAKLISSGIVLLALLANALFAGSPIGLFAEVAGSVFVAVVMVQLAVSMWKQALPSLLDRALEERQQVQINRALIAQFDAYDSLGAVRSRLSGNTAYVEIELGFLPERTMADIQAAMDRITTELATLLPGASVTVIPRLSAPAHAGPGANARRED